MNTLITSIAMASLSLLAIGTAEARGGLAEAGALEHARANARAGGPTSQRDADLLEQWGCLSGTKSAFCQRLANRGADHNDRRRGKVR
jgi:hypothetical protein